MNFSLFPHFELQIIRAFTIGVGLIQHWYWSEEKAISSKGPLNKIFPTHSLYACIISSLMPYTKMTRKLPFLAKYSKHSSVMKVCERGTFFNKRYTKGGSFSVKKVRGWTGVMIQDNGDRLRWKRQQLIILKKC